MPSTSAVPSAAPVPVPVPVPVRRRLLSAGTAAVGLSWLAACATGGRAGGPTVVDGRSGAPVTARQLRERVDASRLVLLGERHDNPEHHRIRAELITGWLAVHRSRSAAVAFEQLDREHDDALRQAQRDFPLGRQPLDEVVARWLDAAHFDRTGWRWPLHRPVFEAAAGGGGRWIAANFSRASAQALMRRSGGVPAAPDPVLQALVEAADWPDAARQSLDTALRVGHCQRLPETALPMIARMQRLRDAALAQPLRDAADRPTLLVAGNGHVRRDHGVPRYLGALAADALVVGFVEREAAGGDAEPWSAGAYDLVVFTGAPQRPASDCAAMG